MIEAPDAKGAFASPLDRPGHALDIALLGSAGLLLFFGLACLHSIDLSSRHSSWMVRQGLWAIIGLGVLLVCARARERRWLALWPWLYGFSLLSLLAVLRLGKNVKGATRWIDVGPIQFQPSEFAKFVLIVALAAYFASRWDERRELRTYVGSLGLVAPMVALILAQPHLAGSVSLVVVWLSVALVAGVPTRFVVATVALVGGLLALAWYTPGVIQPYMRARIMAKLNPDTKGNAYQQDRAKVAFGVGGLYGVGYGRGEQKAGRFIPEQQNDFVFTVVGEELGLVGCALVVAGFLFFFFRVWLVGRRAASPFGQCLSAGVLAILGFHTMVNLGMNVGLLPVAGLWLPFLSYGGTALWLCMACVGLLLGVK